ncbi:MAG: DUF3536 domain-containing protein, partial [Chloroflexi bacterium]|nr:DUF3536 domain-containing protein [Chloroflexota bacterium]
MPRQPRQAQVAERHLCIHGHFYQPLRVDPFGGEVPDEPGAEPYRNFNEKIDVECYRPNARLGNFRRISFDIGPTLTSWLSKHDAHTLRRIVRADEENVLEFGRGNAMAQPYHHTILPLATRRDKEIQVDWGIADFQHHFGRPPQGMWLPETAVDLETLEVLAERGIRFTILAPHQAVGQPVVPGRVSLPSGRGISVLFYDADLSNSVAFDAAATEDARRFALSFLRTDIDRRLVLIASDGELYGHHQPERERFLRDLLVRSASRAGFKLTTPANYLHDLPTSEQVEIVENTSWSCAHGLARWKRNCACTEGDGKWKAHLRASLDRLAEAVDRVAETAAAGLTRDYWRSCKEYSSVLLGTEDPGRFVAARAPKELSAGEVRKMLALLEAQYYRQAMYTSCAFFWEDISRIEPRNVVGYALRSLRLVEEATGISLESAFVKGLRRAKSWRTKETGADIYRKWGKGAGRPMALTVAGLKPPRLRRSPESFGQDG